MSIPSQDNEVENTKQSDKEINFRNLESKYQRELSQRKAEIEEERARRIELERRFEESRKQNDDDDEESEPYVDYKKLNKKLAKHGQQVKQETQGEIQRAVQTALHEERKQNWIKQNSDFYDVMKLAQKLYEKDQELAETILEMPDTFERQKLVYKNIKALGLDKPEVKQPSIQEKVDANRRSPFYQPSGVATSPYSSQGDFSPNGQKSAYEKMQELKSRLRI